MNAQGLSATAKPLKGSFQMRTFLLLLLSTSAAQAHVGHLGEFAGHDHWVAGAAIGAAISLAGWQLLKGDKTEDKEEAPETEEAEA